MEEKSPNAAFFIDAFNGSSVSPASSFKPKLSLHVVTPQLEDVREKRRSGGSCPVERSWKGHRYVVL